VGKDKVNNYNGILEADVNKEIKAAVVYVVNMNRENQA